MSTKQLTVPSSVFQGKENSILRKENNKTIWTHKSCQGGMGKNMSNVLCSHALTLKTFLLPPWSPFSFFFVLSVTQKIDLSRNMWASLFITFLSKFHIVYNT